MKALLVATLLLAVATAGCLDDIVGGPDRGSPYDYIQDKKYTRWEIEIDAVAGEAPSSAVLDALKTRLKEVVRKDSIVTSLDDTIPGKSIWTRSDIDRLHEQYADGKTGGDTAVTHVVYLDGRYENENVLGVTIGHDFVAMFGARIDAGCDSGPLGSIGCSTSARNTAHTAVLVHEFGHVLGLVDNGVPMVRPHEASTCDTADGPKADSGHSDNSNSVMWCSAETIGLFGLNNVPTNFDADDKRDLCAAGGKGSC